VLALQPRHAQTLSSHTVGFLRLIRFFQLFLPFLFGMLVASALSMSAVLMSLRQTFDHCLEPITQASPPRIPHFPLFFFPFSGRPVRRTFRRIPRFQFGLRPASPLWLMRDVMYFFLENESLFPRIPPPFTRAYLSGSGSTGFLAQPCSGRN